MTGDTVICVGLYALLAGAWVTWVVVLYRTEGRPRDHWRNRP